jgi:proteasome lid subunit RPN8/RPN11
MSSWSRGIVAALLIGISTCTGASDATPDCFLPEVQTHVRRTIAIYGPMSIDNEFFGFIYRQGNRIDSGVVRSRSCQLGDCVINVAVAAQRIPKGARVLGEWHTHPRGGSRLLSSLDVRGAYQNRHLACYAAYFSRPDGEILAWNPREKSVPTAMASLVSVGNYAARSG